MERFINYALVMVFLTMVPLLMGYTNHVDNDVHRIQSWYIHIPKYGDQVYLLAHINHVHKAFLDSDWLNLENYINILKQFARASFIH